MDAILGSPEWLGRVAAVCLLVAAGGWAYALWLQRARRVLAGESAQLARQLAVAEAQLAMQGEALSDGRDELSRERAEAQSLRTELSRLTAVHEERLAAAAELKESFETARSALRTEFQQLAGQILEEKGRTFSQTSQDSLAQLLRPFREQIDQFQRRVNEVHDAAVQGQARLGSEIRQVREVGLQMSAEADTLARALKGDKKTLGNWGEVQLARSLQLAGLVEGDHYAAQVSLRDMQGQRFQPDFVVYLPDGKHIVIDSKVSLVDYERAIEAATPQAREAALAAHVQAVRRHLEDLARKDYSNLPGVHSPGFVLMFMPIEAAYIEALKQGRGLFDEGYRQNVILVSHTTLMPILRTVANLWVMARSNEQARALSDMAGLLHNQVVTVAERLQKLGNTLGTALSHYNHTVTAVAGQQGLYGKVHRFSELSVRARRALPAIEPLAGEADTRRLASLVEDEDEAKGEATDGTGSPDPVAAEEPRKGGHE